VFFRRNGRVLIDLRGNRGHQRAIAPYATMWDRREGIISQTKVT